MSAATTTLGTAAAAPSGLRSASSNRRRVVRRLLREPIGLAAMGLVLGMIALALLAPLLSLDDPLAQNLDQGFQGTGSTGHWLGTDLYGRDILSRVIVATRVDVGIALASVALVFSAGGLVGLAAGFYGGWVDAVIGRIADTIMALPLFVLAMGIVAALGNTIPNIVLVTAIWMWLFSRKPPPS